MISAYQSCSANNLSFASPTFLSVLIDANENLEDMKKQGRSNYKLTHLSSLILKVGRNYQISRDNFISIFFTSVTNILMKT